MLIRKLNSFVSLSNVDRKMLDRISTETRSIAPRMELVREGDKPASVLLITEGIACRHKHRACGTRQIIAFLLPGDLCDLDAALVDRIDHTITTVTACRVADITHQTMADLLGSNPAVALALRMSTLVDRAITHEWLVNVSSRSAVKRIAHLICELFVRFKAVGLVTHQSYMLPLTQTDLAHTMGLSTVHTNRSLQELRRRGLITLKGKQLTVLDVSKLRAIAEFDPTYLYLKA
ncbi:Crp/Fnr family transcriptional regulator [Methylobacterium goesingense]|uniref:CRP-like cAMP-binding protein n=1 Tax=Methylobacterium goesingense TaxID=243690 RepID=A0ABV2LAZ2_9HYPH|nr:Crp/Fnr family transcriptional regulator [Methylobacterium goesingense]